MRDANEQVPDAYLAEHVRDALDRDPRTCGLEIDVTVEGRVVLLGGTVLTEERRALVEQVVKEFLPDWTVQSNLIVGDLAEPTRAEHLA